ncbi:myosin light chain kinase, smooth muscle-like isoform X2 [Carassius carassius]|uniref:myosin light chain kinase, smooth muscle-like isoform X2 n=1 Tax=Carassius carassius TaxID=217509 RepID=UPI0028696F40|nr:myosin light chain kinase, smooth muscle-like isoform X2 [Carassius carassius]
MMGDVQFVTGSHVSKMTLTLGQGSPSTEPPVFTLPPRNTRVCQGGTARLEGKVRGFPEPQVCWFRNGKLLIAGDHYSMEQSARGTFSLAVQDVQDEDGGRYTCEAVNDAGSRQVTMEIIVEGNAGKKYSLPSSNRAGGSLGVPAVDNRPSIWGESPPKFVAKPSRIYLKVGQSGKFSAKITGRPQPLVQWYKGEEKIQQSDHYNMFERSGMHFLEIRHICSEDAGVYTCLVANSAGKASATTELIVQDGDTETVTVPKASQDLSKPFVVKHSTNGFDVEQKPSNTSIRTATTETHKTHTPPSTTTVTRTDKPKITSSLCSQPINKSTDGKSAPGQKTSNLANVRSQNIVKNESSSIKRASDSFRDPEEIPEASRLESSIDARQQTTESKVDMLETPPSFDSQPQSREVVPGEKVTFRCQVSGSPVPTVSWMKDGAPLRQRSGVSTRQEGSLHVLCLENAHITDTGQYGCTAANTRGKTQAHWSLTVKRVRVEAKPPVFISPLKDCSVSEGQDFILQCSVEGRPLPELTWLHNDQPVPYSHTVFENSMTQLTVKASVLEDAGMYSCVAVNDHGRAVCTAHVLVNAKSSVKRSAAPPGTDARRPSAPVFLRGLQDLSVMDGSQVTMTVEVTGNPAPEVVWLHNGKEIQESEDFHFEREGCRYTLFIQEVFPEDTGTYTCEVWNEAGVAQTEASLTVQEPQDGVQPWFITKAKSSTAFLGQHALLSCAIAGDPFPEFLWMKDEQVISGGGDFEILQKDDVVSLLIRNVKTHHAGNYEIYLKNKVGECRSVATLHVSEDPMPSGDNSHKRRGVERTAPGRGGQPETLSAAASLSEPLWEHNSQDQEEEEGCATRGLLKRRIETKEHQEDQIRQQEAEQIDFRTVLGRKVSTKSVSEEDLKEITPEQMDFRGNLQRQIKPKTQTEEERKVNSPQQVDFRAVLGKKGSQGPKPALGSLVKAQNIKTEAVDFRSVLGNKKKLPSQDRNGESQGDKDTQGKENDVNCVDGGIKEKTKAVGKKEPIFTHKLSDVTVLDGERLHLQCQLSSESPTKVTWTLDGKLIKSSKFIVISNEGGKCSLTIDKALPEDEGEYVCRAETNEGKTECSCMVLVDDPSVSTPADKRSRKPSTPTTENEAKIKKPPPKTHLKQGSPPQILQFPDDMKILAGQDVSLLCQFTGAQPISCTWLKFRKPIQEGQGISIVSTDSSSQLTIPEGQQEHCGCYTIELKNGHGARQAALNLTIVDKPDPPARVPAASDIRKSSLTLSWYGPTYDGGSAVQSYNLEMWSSVDMKWTDLASCNSTSYNVQNLLPDRQYKFRVRAVNIYGVGEPSAESAPVQVGLGAEEENKEDEAEPSDDESEKERDYRNVTIRTDVKVKDLYDVEDRLGSGKFGTVFKLIEKSTKKAWAGKFIKAYSAKEKENVRQEIAIMNDLHHPKLVQCVDAFEGKTDIVMVLDMISGGELFERIIDEDFELTEREVIKYMLQIVDGVNFIHKKGIVHLDLKPENIMCVNKTGSKIKLIDFGLARRLENAGSLKVLFGTPEFVAPEVINYEAISYATDMWSIGVICYILVSGLSPFMGDNDNETLSNVTSATWDFEDEAFDEISDEAKDFISNLLKKDMKARLSCDQCFQHPWLKQDTTNMEAKKLSKERMKKYILRRKWQKTGHAVRAIGRLSNMALLAGVHAKKSSPTEEDKEFAAELEEKTRMKATFSSVIKDVEVVEGSAARFDCKIEGYPDPEVVWFKDDQPIKETRHFQIDYDEDGNCSLVISEVSGDDDAKYTCKAMNSVGEATCTAELIVEVMGEEEEEEEEEEE